MTVSYTVLKQQDLQPDAFQDTSFLAWVSFRFREPQTKSESISRLGLLACEIRIEAGFSLEAERVSNAPQLVSEGPSILKAIFRLPSSKKNQCVSFVSLD